MCALLSGRLSARNRKLRAGAQGLSLAAERLDEEAPVVAFAVQHWLEDAPDGPIEYGSKLAERAVTVLVDAWSAAIVHELARGPMTSAELAEAIEDLDPSGAQSRLTGLHGVALAEAVGQGDEALYAATDWLRLAIAPLIAAARLERGTGMAGAAPVDAFDVEAGFRMALEVIEMPEELSGACCLRLNLDEGVRDRCGGVTARFDCGELISCEATIEAPSDAWAMGDLDDWLDTVLDPNSRAVRTGGDRWLTDALVAALSRDLFGLKATPRGLWRGGWGGFSSDDF